MDVPSADPVMRLLRRLCGRRRLGGGRAGSRLGSWLCGWGRRGRRIGDHSRLDGIKLWEALVKIGFALLFNLALVDACAVSVLVIEHVHDFHAFGVDGGERREATGVEGRIVLQIDEDLGGTRVWTGGGEGDVTLFVALSYGIV